MLDCLKKEILSNAKEYCDECGEELYNVMKSLLQDYQNYHFKGIVALKEESLKVLDENYHNFIKMVIDGFEWQEIENVVISRFYEKNVSSYEAYLYYIFACSAIFMSLNCSPRELICLFESVANQASPIFEKIKSLESYHLKEEFEEIKLLLEQGKYADVFDFEPCEDFFSKIITQLSNRNIQRILCYCDQFELARALKFSTPETLNKIFENLSRAAACMLVDDLKFENCTEKESLDAKRKILSIFMEMEIESIEIKNKD